LGTQHLSAETFSVWVYVRYRTGKTTYPNRLLSYKLTNELNTWPLS